MPVVARTDWTVDMLDELPDDGQRYELIDGELVIDINELFEDALS